MTQTPSHGDVIIGEHYYILASEAAAGLPKVVLKHDEAFLVANRRGDLPAQEAAVRPRAARPEGARPAAASRNDSPSER